MKNWFYQILLYPPCSAEESFENSLEMLLCPFKWLDLFEAFCQISCFGLVLFLYFSLSSSVSNNLFPPCVWTMGSPLWGLIHPPCSSVEHAMCLTEGYWSSAKRGGSWTPERKRRAIHSSRTGSAPGARRSSAFHRIFQRLPLFFSPLDLAAKRRLLCT